MTFLQALLLAAMMAVSHYLYYVLWVTGLPPEEANLLLYRCNDRAFFQTVALLIASFVF